MLTIHQDCKDPVWSSENVEENMTIIVHGTWASMESWWRNGSNFWNYLNTIRGNLYQGLEPFCWSGKNSHKARLKAAESLKDWCDIKQVKEIDIVAHSHGGNVCCIATNLGVKIRNLILLGTPIRLEYIPDYKIIKNIHNVFSTKDIVQTPSGTAPNRRNEGRSLADTNMVQNHFAFDNGNGKRPGHSELHEELTWKTCSLQECFN